MIAFGNHLCFTVCLNLSLCVPLTVCSAELLHPMTMISSLGNGRVDWIQAEKWWSNPHIKWNSLRNASSIRCLTASSLLVMLQILIKMLIHGHFTVTTGAFQLSIYISQVPKSSNWRIIIIGTLYALLGMFLPLWPQCTCLLMAASSRTTHHATKLRLSQTSFLNMLTVS